jgi:hypothetical protein
MSVNPHRVQLSRRKGWQMPENTVKVSRPGVWGNPFVVTEKMKPGATVGGAWSYVAVPTVEDAVACYAEMMATDSEPGHRAHELRKRLPELRGRNLACWCRLDQPCHADVLLELANQPVES